MYADTNLIITDIAQGNLRAGKLAENPRPDPRRRANPGAAPWGTVRACTLTAFEPVVAQLGADADDLLCQVGLSRQFLHDPENNVPFRTVGRLLRLAVEATRCRHVGLLMGQRTGMSSLGAVGFLMRSSPTVGDALRALVTHFGANQRGSAASLQVGSPLATISYVVLVPGVEALEQIYPVAIGIGINSMREMCGDEWRAEEITFSFADRDANAFRKAFKAPIRFNAERTGFVFSTTRLSQPLKSADPVLYRMMMDRVEALQVDAPLSLVERSRQLLAPMVLMPGCSAAMLASRLGLHERTLFRRLAREGVTFQSLRDEACRTTAYELLANTDRRAVEVAATLGYSDPAAFTRAFRRWSGTTPTAWRARCRKRDS
jgi:AraC-like DNA-binding protein